jgi:DNA mismatch repair protein MutL
MDAGASMSTHTTSTPSVRVLPEDVANKIAAGEVVERPASVVKELVENALDARATRISVQLVAAGRRRIEIIDNGHGMSEQDALLAIERHATSKIRKAEDLDNINTLGFRGEALASIAAVSRFELITRRAKDDAATRIRVDGGVLRDVSQVAGPVGTRITVNRLYFNTPVRAKFLKGVTTELSQSIDAVQRYALAEEGVGFELLHNEKALLNVPDNASLRERVALIWGLNFANDLVEVEDERGSLKIRGLIGNPVLSRSQRSHQFFFMNGRPVVNRSLQYGFEDGYRGLLTIGRHPVGILMLQTHPRFVDVNIHPTKREIRFRDDRAARDTVRDIVRERLASLQAQAAEAVLPAAAPDAPTTPPVAPDAPASHDASIGESAPAPTPDVSEPPVNLDSMPPEPTKPASWLPAGISSPLAPEPTPDVQTEFLKAPVPEDDDPAQVAPAPVYEPLDALGETPMQLFDTYLLIPDNDRLLIIDQHALHERLRYDNLVADLDDPQYEAQQLMVPILIDVPPSHAKLLASNLDMFERLGMVIESFGGNTFQVTAICNDYDEAKVSDVVYRVLDELAQGDLFDREALLADLMRLATTACRGSVKAGDWLSPEERRGLIEGFHRLRPPYTCPHGRPIVTELTLFQMEKSFRRRQ